MKIYLGECIELKSDALKENIDAIDKILFKEYKNNGFSQKFISNLDKRGFSYKEYLALFDFSIIEEEFLNHMIFIVLRIEGEFGSFNGTEWTQGRKDFTNSYSADEEGYLALLAKVTGGTFFRSKREGFRWASLKAQTHITGQNGSGKSQFMRLIFWYVHKRILKKKKVSAILLDVHGDLAHEIKTSKLNVGNDRLIYFSARLKDGYYPVINPFQIDDPRLIDKTTEFLAEAFDELLKDSDLSDQMRTILIPCIRTIIKAGGKNLEDLQKFMLDDKELISLGLQSEIHSHREFFKNRFTDKTFTRTKNSIYTRIQNLLNSPQFSAMTLGENTIDLKKAMNGGKVIIFNLSGLGVLTKEALGRFIVAQVKAIAENRESIIEKRRPTTYFFIDEMQHFVTKSIEVTLSEMRKFKLYLILAHQYIHQLGDLHHAVMSNCKTKVVFYNSDHDINRLAGYLGKTKDEMKHKWGMFECWIKTGRRKTFKIKPSAKLIKRKKYTMSRKEERELDLKMITTYYRKPENLKSHNEISKGSKKSQFPDENFF